MHARRHRPHWAHLDGIAGYVFLDVDDLDVTTEQRTGSWNAINTGGPTPEVGTPSPDSSPGTARHRTTRRRAYSVLPTASARTTRAEAERCSPRVLISTAKAQAVWHDGYVAICTWAPTRVAGFGVGAPAAVLLGQHGRDLLIAVLEPVGTRDQIVITVPGRCRSGPHRGHPDAAALING